MNKTVNKFLLTGDKSMPELHLNACDLFTKHQERIQKIREAGDLSHIYKNKLDKACFAHDAAYSESKN